MIFAKYFFIGEDRCTMFFPIEIPIADYFAYKKVFSNYDRGGENSQTASLLPQGQKKILKTYIY